MSDSLVATESGPGVFARLWARVQRLFEKKPEGNFISHARREFVALGYDLDQKEEDPNKWIVENVMELLQVFDDPGHLESSAAFCVDYFEKLANFKPLSPLKGTSEEWTKIDHGSGVNYQNKRSSAVFADGPNGEGAYHSCGRVFVDKGGWSFTTRGSSVPIEFPYTPTVVRVVEGTPEAEPFTDVFARYNDEDADAVPKQKED